MGIFGEREPTPSIRHHVRSRFRQRRMFWSSIKISGLPVRISRIALATPLRKNPTKLCGHSYFVLQQAGARAGASRSDVPLIKSESFHAGFSQMNRHQCPCYATVDDDRVTRNLPDRRPTRLCIPRSSNPASAFPPLGPLAERLAFAHGRLRLICQLKQT
jgi:hypothetical protein